MSRRDRERRQGPRGPKYLSEVIAKSGQLSPGSAYVITVVHDGGCRQLRGTGPCNCNPEIGHPERVPSPEEN